MSQREPLDGRTRMAGMPIDEDAFVRPLIQNRVHPRLVVGTICISLAVAFAVKAGILGIAIGLFHATFVWFLFYLLRKRRWITAGTVAAMVAVNFLSWAFLGRTHDAFVCLPYDAASIYELDFAVIFGDAAENEQLDFRTHRESLCADVQQFFYEGQVDFEFGQVTDFGDWYESRLDLTESNGLHFNVDTQLHSPMIRIVREEFLGRGLYGSGSDVVYIWFFYRWVPIYRDLRWFS